MVLFRKLLEVERGVRRPKELKQPLPNIDNQAISK
jgi:hypothetical protein